MKRWHVAGVLVVVAALAAGLALVMAPNSKGDEGIGGAGRATEPVLFGAYVSTAGPKTLATQIAAVDDLEAKLGRKLDISMTFVKWGQPTQAWLPRARADVAAGRTPLLSFGEFVSLADVADGKHDQYLRSFADGVRSLHHPVMLRFAYEMDLERTAGYIGSPETFVRAWRHVHDLFGEVPGAAWVWSPNAARFPKDTARMNAFWPGDDYVDWIGADGYNWYGCNQQGNWGSFQEIFAGVYAWAADKGKPVIVAETGSTEDPADPARKGEWLRDAAAALQEMPRIRAVVWFDSPNRECASWVVDSSGPTMSAFRQFVRAPAFTTP